MTILVTGGAGFIGSALLKSLKNKDGVSAIGMDLSPYAELGVLACSTLDPIRLRNLFEANEIESIIHLGMASSEREALKAPELARASIVQGTQNLISLFNEFGGKRFVFVSSSMVYGHFQKEQIDELHPTRPIELYGRLKLEAEESVRAQLKNFSIVRPIAVYGPHDPKKRVVTALYERARQGLPLMLENPESRLDFTHLNDVVKGLEQVLESEHAQNQVFNLSYGQGHTLRELCQYIKEIYPHLTFHESQNTQGKAMRGSLCNKKIRSLCGFAPTIALREGIRDLHQSVQSEMRAC